MNEGAGLGVSRKGEAGRVIRVLLCDDHEMFRDGIAMKLGYLADMEVVGEVSNGRDAVELVRALNPDVVVMDLNMPDMNGLEAMKRIKAENETTRVLIVSGYSTDSDVLEALDAGAMGYVLKDSPSVVLFKAVRNAAEGMPHVSYEVASRLAALRQVSATRTVLTDREARVLRLVAEGKATREIAQTVLVSERTVKGDLELACTKLNAKNRTHAAALAVQRGMIRVTNV